MKRAIYILSVLWTVGMVYLLLTPGDGLPEYFYFEGQDKLAHLLLFAGWSFFLFLAVSFLQRRVALKIAIIGVIFAALTEWMQYYIPYRSADLLDFVFDVAGTFAGIGVAFFVKKELIRIDKKFEK